MVAANPNQNGNPNQDTGVKPHPERIARKLKIFFLLYLQVVPFVLNLEIHNLKSRHKLHQITGK